MDKSTKFWDRVSRGKEVTEGGATFRRTLDLARQYLGLEDKVLDFGSGPGSLTLAIASSVASVVGIDTSPGMVASAKQRADRAGTGNARFSCADLFDCTLEPASFDAVLAFNVLPYVDDLPACLARISRLLKPGGRFISSTACLGGRISLPGSVVYVLCKARLMPPMRFFSGPDLLDEIDGAGFNILADQVVGKSTKDLFVVAMSG